MDPSALKGLDHSFDCFERGPVHELEAREARAAVEGKENDQHEMEGHDEAALAPVKRALTLLRALTKY